MLDQPSLPAAVELARLPEIVRGYEEIKLTGIARFGAELESRLAAF